MIKNKLFKELYNGISIPAVGPLALPVFGYDKNDDLDAVLDEARRATDPADRQALYSEAQEMLVELAPMLYLNHQEYLLGVDESVKDSRIDAQGIYKIKDAYIEQ